MKRVDKEWIDNSDNGIIADNNNAAHKQKFCDKIKRETVTPVE
jgi:hypothetical protein